MSATPHMEYRNTTDNQTFFSDEESFNRLWNVFRKDAAWFRHLFVCVEALMLLVAGYIFSSHFYHAVVSQKENGRKPTNKSRLLLLIAVMFCSSMSIAKFILAQAIANIQHDRHTCAAFAKANRAVNILGFTSLSTFLWLRQRVLYNLPQLKHLATRVVIWWSRVTLLCIVITTVGGILVIVFHWKSSYWMYNGKCVSNARGLSKSALSGVTICIAVQISMLTLFIKFIVKNRFRGRPSVIDKKSSSLLKRCCILTAICVMGDVITITTTTLSKGHAPELLTVLIVDMDQFLGLLCVVFCFAQWKKSFFSWPCCSFLRRNGFILRKQNAKEPSKFRVASISKSNTSLTSNARTLTYSKESHLPQTTEKSRTNAKIS
ncbi:unnamed protein product [Clavelina lepadiformis]|uniref:Uncharacterized protein n=1 Tax=Clavelina lepadiformis TaxID=159417 RepID=A0ABP0FZN8_CLALP